MRYGQRYQMGKANQEASLFGGTELIDTVKPEPPHRDTWSDIERLNYEKDLVGMYLSAHPLDRYYMELTYGCNLEAKDYSPDNLELNKEYVMGGLVVEAKTLTSKTGSQFGILKIEDYSGAAELRLFGQDFINYNKYGVVGSAIMVTLSAAKGKYNDRIYTSIRGIQLLENVQGQVISGIQLNMTEQDACNEQVEAVLDEYIRPGDKNGRSLYVSIENAKEQKPVLMSSPERIVLNRDLLLRLDELGVEYDIKTMA